MRIAVLGAGGVGGYYAGILARAGNDVAVLARGDNLRAIRDRGVRVRTPEEEFAVEVVAEEDVTRLGTADFALVTVKAYSLDSLGAAARRLADAGADVLPLLNGVEAVDRLRDLGIPVVRLLGGLTYISAARAEPGVFERRSPFQRVVVGEPAGGASRRTERIAAAFRAAGAEARASGDITTDLWRKFIFLVSLSAACGLSRTSVGPLRRKAEGRLLLERAVREALLVARSRGAALDDAEERQVLELIAGLPDPMKPSFLLDVEAGGPTELDILSGAVSRFGRESGVATPVHDTAVGAIGAAVTAQVSSR